MNQMHITETAALAMHDIAEWFLVDREDTDYVNPVTFNKAWNH